MTIMVGVTIQSQIFNLTITNQLLYLDMKDKLDIELKPIIIKCLDSQFEMKNDTTVYDKCDGGETTPEQMQRIISDLFNIDDQGAYIVTYEWLYVNGMKDIQANWFGIINFVGYNTAIGNLDHPQPEFDFPVIENIISGVTDTVVLGNNNTVNASNTVVLGSDNIIDLSDYPSFSGASMSYSMGIDPATYYTTLTITNNDIIQ